MATAIETALHTAAFNGDMEAVKNLLKKGVDIEGITKIIDVDGTAIGYTPLHVASFEGHYEIVRWLAEVGGANVDAKVLARS
jgi:ankyrin repeat protein